MTQATGAPMIATSSEPWDAIVVGSGITGGFAAMELTRRGLKTLVLERGPDVTHSRDYQFEHTRPWQQPSRGRPQRRHLAETKPIQSRTGFMLPTIENWFVDDTEHPYIEERPFSWIRGYQVGGRSLTWGRQSYRLSDLDFTANAREGIAVDWPIRYKDLAPWYDYVEGIVGISGRNEGLSQLPDGNFLPPMCRASRCPATGHPDPVRESGPGPRTRSPLRRPPRTAESRSATAAAGRARVFRHR